MSTDLDDIPDVVVEPRYSAEQLKHFPEHVVAGIAARVDYHALPWWRRWRAPRPPSWEQTTRVRR